MRLLYILLLIILTNFSCSEDKNHQPFLNYSDFSETNSIKSNQDSSLGQAGISTSPDIIVKNGQIVINLKDGNISTGKGKVLNIAANDQINGILTLRNAVTMAIINVTTVVTDSSIFITPNNPLDSTNVYNLIFLDNKTGTEYQERIYISEANACLPESNFSKVAVNRLPPNSNKSIDVPINKSIYEDKSHGKVAIIGWDHLHSNSFYFRINNRTPGAKYKIITALSEYDIKNHECELYYQRAISTPFPTWTDNNYGYKVTKVTNEDTALHNPTTNIFYNFTKTYVLVKVYNSSNVDITDKDTAILSLEQTDTIYGLPVSYNSDEESSLLAYLNRGNNNGYSMVLGGLIVGIFSFFLSRRLIKRNDDNL